MHTIRFLVLILFAGNLSADQTLRLPNIFGPKMVLQQGKPVHIWGWAKAGAEVKVLAALDDGRVVAVREGRMLATAFHPELTDDTRVHELFVRIVKSSK